MAAFSKAVIDRSLAPINSVAFENLEHASDVRVRSELGIMVIERTPGILEIMPANDTRIPAAHALRDLQLQQPLTIVALLVLGFFVFRGIYGARISARTIDVQSQKFRGRWRDTIIEPHIASTAQAQTQHASSGPDAQAQSRKTAQKTPSQSPLSADARAHLSTLGLRHFPDPAGLRRHYRELAKTWHPDRFVSDTYSAAERADAAQHMSDINLAYTWLKNQTS